MPHYPKTIEHSQKYEDEAFYYKHVKLTKEAYKRMPKGRKMTEEEVTELGVIQTKGWENYTVFFNEPHVLLFRKRKM